MSPSVYERELESRMLKEIENNRCAKICSNIIGIESKGFIIAWDKYKRNIGKTRTMAGVHAMAVLAEKENPGIAKEFFDAWENRHNG
jgi:hypothetical protein